LTARLSSYQTEHVSIDSSVLSVADPDSEQAGPSEQAVTASAEIFGLLSDPGRLRLLIVLAQGEASVGVLARSAGLSESAASHALRLLRAHRVVVAHREGRMVHYRLVDERVRRLLGIGLANDDELAASTGTALSDGEAVKRDKRDGKRSAKRGKGKRSK
jgi:ArsR family transcriptional regulator, lead/cadmium/zinc/bismuth-responsive transcriptional repressor